MAIKLLRLNGTYPKGGLAHVRGDIPSTGWPLAHVQRGKKQVKYLFALLLAPEF